MQTTLHQQILVPAGNRSLTAELTIPAHAEAIVIFARAGADSHLNKRDKAVAAQLQKAGFGTLLPDLLTEKEVLSSHEFDIDLLTARLLIVTKWLQERDLFGHYRLAYFAVNIGAAAAIQAATCLEETIGAIVCRGARTDLALTVIPELQSPTLLIAGSLDLSVLQFNRDALDSFSCPKRLDIIQGATHLFSDDKINEVAALAVSWFGKYLRMPAAVANKKKQHMIFEPPVFAWSRNLTTLNNLFKIIPV